MNRRSFLIGASSAILTPAFFKDAVRYVEHKSEPLLITPDKIQHTLYAIRHGGSGLGYSLWLDNHPEEEPNWSMSWEEFLKLSYGYDRKAAIAELINEYGVDEDEAAMRIDETVDQEELLDWHYDNELGSGLAVEFFQSIDLGPDFNTGAGKGEVRFADNACYGPDRWTAEAADRLSLSLLQARLNELNSGVKIEISKCSFL